MNLTFRLIYAAHCNGTHHKIAVDSLRYLKNEQGEAWRKLFLTNIEAYVEGSKAPDKTFKDFKNHVLHVRDNYWGGAADKSAEWYNRLVHNLKVRNWREAAYSAGVLSHYYADALHPFHTAQSEAESNIHRAVEWSISKSYDQLREVGIEQWPSLSIEIPEGTDWVKTLVQNNASFSNQYYETLLTHYNFDKGVVDPLEGFDQTANEAIAKILRLGIISFSHVLDRAFVEAAVQPLKTTLTVKGFLSGLKIPLRWVLNKLEDRAERQLVQNMYDELQRTGTVESLLSDDDRAIKQLYEKEVLSAHGYRRKQRESHALFAASTSERQTYHRNERKKQAVELKRQDEMTFHPAKTDMDQLKSELSKVLPPKQQITHGAMTEETSDTITQLNTQSHYAEAEKQDKANDNKSRSQRKARFYLSLTDPVADGPGVGDKTALRLAKLDIYTVADFLRADAITVADSISLRNCDGQDIADWQNQANLMCHIPGLKAIYAKLLVASDINSPKDVASMTEEALTSMLYTFSLSEEGQKILRNKTLPSSQIVEDWIYGAKGFLSQQAA